MPNPNIKDRSLALVPDLPVEDPAYIQGLPALHEPRDPVQDAVAQLLYALGVDEGDHTAETPARVAKSWRAQLAGYSEDPAKHLDKQFSAPSRPGLVAVHGIRFSSTCAHHLLPITGTASIAYRAQDGGDVVGLSKLARVLEGYARRLQVQERIGSQVVEAIAEKLAPVGAVVVITAEHGCMTVRGVNQPGAATTTVSTAGAWDEYHPDVQNVLAIHHGARG